MHSGYPCILDDRCWVQKPFVTFYWERHLAMHNMLICPPMIRRIIASYWCEQTATANPKAQLFRSWNENPLIKPHSQFIITHAEGIPNNFCSKHAASPWHLSFHDNSVWDPYHRERTECTVLGEAGKGSDSYFFPRAVNLEPIIVPCKAVSMFCWWS